MSRVRTYLERLNSGSLPPKVSFSSGEQAADAYSRGFEGAIYDPDHAAEVETAFAYGRGEDAVRAFGIEGSGEGKLVPLYDLVWRVSGSTELFQGKQSQPVGDCFIEGTLVTMADGSQKPIEDIRAGEMVMAPSGKPRKVLSEFSKKYDGPLRSLEFSGIKGTLVCTPDHRILARRLAHTNHQPHAEWVAAESLVVGRGVFQTLSSGYTAVIGNDEVPGFSGTVYCIEARPTRPCFHSQPPSTTARARGLICLPRLSPTAWGSTHRLSIGSAAMPETGLPADSWRSRARPLVSFSATNIRRRST